MKGNEKMVLQTKSGKYRGVSRDASRIDFRWIDGDLIVSLSIGDLRGVQLY